MLTLSHVLLWLVALGQAWLIIVLVQQIAELRNHVPASLSPLPLGFKAPAFSALSLSSGELFHAWSLRGSRTVLCFLSTECRECRRLAGDLVQQPAHKLAGLVIYGVGTPEATKMMLATLARMTTVLMKDRIDVDAAYRISTFPVAVTIDAAGRIESFHHPTRVSDLLSYAESVRGSVGQHSGTHDGTEVIASPLSDPRTSRP